MKILSYARRNWRRLLVANALSLALQGIVLVLLLWLGVGILTATVSAKGISWTAFFAQLAVAR